MWLRSKYGHNIEKTINKNTEIVDTVDGVVLGGHMTVDRIGPIDSVQQIKKTEAAKEVKKTSQDSIDVSHEARQQALIYQTKELAKAAPDVRMEKIAELKDKLELPNAYDESVVKTIADKILHVFGL